MSLFCYQCEQAAGGRGCQGKGLCGKSAEAAHLQNLLLAWSKHLAVPANQMRVQGNSSQIIDHFIVEALYSTVTNVNFDTKVLARQIHMAYRMLQLAEYLAKEKKPEYQTSLETEVSAPIEELTDSQIQELIEQGQAYSVGERQKEHGELVVGLQELILDGIKGAAAYTWHLLPLSRRMVEHRTREVAVDSEFLKTIRGRDTKDRQQKAELKVRIATEEQELKEWAVKERDLLDRFYAQLAFLAGEPTDIEALVEAALEAGRLNLQAMEMLEWVHIQNFGKPSPTVVRLTPSSGKCILVSGHDLGDLHDLLVQTEGKGINIYTHGEMLPAHSYPQLKKFSHLVGHYGGAWYQQQKEFDGFPGAILMTSNCIQEPQDSYHDYIFTTGSVRWPGVTHITADKYGRKDFAPVIKAALDSSGFFRAKVGEKLTVGFGADAIAGLFDQVRRAIQQKKFSRFYLIGGCDGPGDERNCFTELAQRVPEDAVILTLGCGKYRFNRENFAPLSNGLPRLLDMGQCNDAASAIRLVTMFMEEFNCRLDQVPLSIYLSWYEQKAVAVLLSLLALGVKGIHLGPRKPAFLNAEAMELLSNRFELSLFSGWEEESSPEENA